MVKRAPPIGKGPSVGGKGTAGGKWALPGGKWAPPGGKGKARRPWAPTGGAWAPPAGQRSRISKKRISGQLVQWKGKYGWIRTHEPINHPDAGQRGGKVYVGIEDIEGPELTNNCMVSFVAYADETGIGAMNCRREGGAPAKGAAGKGGVIKTNLKQSGRPAAAAKGQAKGAGKAAKKLAVKTELGEEAEERGPAPPPDKAARWKVQPNRVIGKVIRWRGSTGWIKPLEKIDCAEVPKHKRGIYVHEVDVKKGFELFPGAQVSFLVYADADGLGAMHVMLTEDQPDPDAEAPTAEAKVNGKGKSKGKGKGKGKGGKGDKGDAPKTKMTMVEKMRLKRRRRRKGGDEKPEGEKQKREKREGGPDLPRERITEVPVTGEVVDWKGKYGWLKPTEDVKHDLAENHGGKIYVHEKDILDGAPLTVGQSVEFHIYADKTGLGAEEAIATS